MHKGAFEVMEMIKRAISGIITAVLISRRKVGVWILCAVVASCIPMLLELLRQGITADEITYFSTKECRTDTLLICSAISFSAIGEYLTTDFDISRKTVHFIAKAVLFVEIVVIFVSFMCATYIRSSVDINMKNTNNITIVMLMLAIFSSILLIMFSVVGEKK